MDAVWDVEFTESKPLDDPIKEELTAAGDKAFRNLYQCLLAHAEEQQQSAGSDEASQVKLIHTLLSCCREKMKLQRGLIYFNGYMNSLAWPFVVQCTTYSEVRDIWCPAVQLQK